MSYGYSAAQGRELSGAARDLDTVELERLWRDSGDFYLEHHPVWAKLSAPADVRLRTFTTSDTGRTDSYALVGEGHGALSWLIGEIRIHRRAVERLHAVGGQVVAPDLKIEQRHDRARQFFAWLATEARGRPIFLQSVPVESPLYQVLRSRDHPFWVISHGARQTHFAIDLPNTVERFYEGLGYKTRKSVRYSIRKIEKELQGRIFLKAFSNAEDVERFLNDAMPISRSTYQYHLLELGLRDRDKLVTQFGAMAKLGWWRGYILYCREEPVAFIYGYRVGSTFYYWDVGYQASWSEWSVGTVATVRLIESLIEADDRPSRLDFLYGSHDYKRRLSNRYWEEENFYLFPRNPTNFFISQSLRLTNALSDKGGRILDRYQLKSRAKRFFRRRSVAG